MSLYQGFSTFEFENTGTFRLTDKELVKMDILHHIFTKKGERLYMPTFGTTIPDLVFEPLDNTTASEIEQQLREVINYDPRVELIDIKTTIDSETHTLIAAMKINYIELNTVDELAIQLNFEG
jgi:phage baseplate assembly protein W